MCVCVCVGNCIDEEMFEQLTGMMRRSPSDHGLRIVQVIIPLGCPIDMLGAPAKDMEKGAAQD
eukprot:COSAG05_NODE_825_length_7106_cov_74.690881_8_plen_63_part_00